MKKFSTFLKAVCLIFLTFFTQNTFGQLVASECFLQGSFTEVGIGTCGIFKTNNAAPAAGPLGVYHGNVAGLFGFVCDAGKNGWGTAGGAVTILGCGDAATLPNYCGDYFVPGTPEEGFVVRVNGTNYVNHGTAPGCASANIPGSVTSYTFTATEAIGVWSGNIAIPGGNLVISASTSVPRNKTYFITTVTITNSSPSTATGVYYMRTLDPDNDQPWTGNFSTRNRVRYRPQLPPTIQPDHCYALVESQGGCGGSGNRGCYLGLGAKDSRARGAYGGFTNTDPVAVWNGTGGMTGTVGSVTEGDIGNSLSFNIGDIAAGSSVTVAFCYALSTTDLFEALDLTATESSLTANGADISFSGAANSCNNSPITLAVTSGGSYTWTWAPCTYLNTCTGSTVVATVPSGSITYTATGVSPCNPTLTRTVTVNATPPPPSPTSPGASIFCGQTASLTATAGGGGTIDWYTAVTGGTKLVDNSATYSTGILTSSQTYYIDEYTYAPGSGNNMLPYDETFECVGATVTYSATTNPLNAGGACLNDKSAGEWQFVRSGGSMRARLKPAGITPSVTGGTSFITIDRSASGAAQDGELILTLDLAGYSTATDLNLGFQYLRHGSGTMTVFARRSNAATWMNVGTYNSGVGWQTVAGIDLDAILGAAVTSTFQVRFVVNANNTAANNTTNAGFSLDNVKIRGTENTPPSFCLSTPRTPVNVTVNPLPLPTAANVNLCSPGSATLSATKNSGVSENILLWYNAAVGGTLLTSGGTYVTPVLGAGSHTFWVQESSPVAFDNTYNFATNIDGWTASQSCSATTGTWSWVSDGGVGAMRCANVDNSSQSLTSPPVLLLGANSITFSYNHKLSLESGYDNGIVVYRLHNGTSWGAWTKFTPTTGSYTYSDAVFREPYISACATSPSQTCYSGSAAYTTHSGTVNTTGMANIQFAFFTSSDVSGNLGGWYINWARIQSTSGAGTLCVGPRRAVTVNVGVPSNDNICNAFTASLGDNPGHTNTCATTEASEPQGTCYKAGPMGDPLPKLTRSIWFKFTPTLTRNYLFYIKDGLASNSPVIPATGGVFDSEMGLYQVTGGTVCANTFAAGLTVGQLKCNDDRAATGWYAPHPLYSEFTQTLSVGQTVFVQVDGAVYSNTVAGGVKREEALLNTSTSSNINLFIDIILPADIVAFSAKKTDKFNVLNWEIAKEMNVDKFEVMRSSDGRNFESIGTVVENGSNSYTFNDEKPLSRAYYRLKIIDQDGSSAVSEVVYLSREGTSFNVIELKPNPTKDRFELSFEVEKDQDVRIDLIDATGKIVKNAEYAAKMGINVISFDLSEFNRGLYSLRITSGNDAIVRKVVKE